MRKSFRVGKLLACLLLLSSAYTHSVIVWQDNFTPDATDEDVILGETFIRLDDDVVRIAALTTDVVVTMTSGDTIVQSEDVGNTRLYLEAAAGQSITFQLTNNLTFRGTASGPLVPDLLIAVEGQGEVIFQMDGDKTLTLTRNGSDGGRAQMYVVMNDTSNTLRFERTAVSPNDNVGLNIEGGSILSYLSTVAQPNATDVGRIEWDGTNTTGTGRMILTLGELAAVIVRGRLLTADGDDFTLADIDPATPAGFDAQFAVINDSDTTAGSLLVQNSNNTLGEFIWDPWLNLNVRTNPPFGDFNGVQWGFIVGSYGTLEVDTNAYLDYVSLTGTVCPFTADLECPPVLPDEASKVKARNPSALFTDGQPSPDFEAPRIDIADTAGIYFRSGVDNEGNVRPLGDPNPFTVDPTKKTPGAGFPVFDIEGPLNIVGQNTDVDQRSLFQLLSLEVSPTGGPLFDAPPLIFPLRTFNKITTIDPCTEIETSVYLTYNNASFLNNGRANLYDVSFDHTDQNHKVFENNDVLSEPAYIGGETWLLQPCIARPKWAFVNSRFNVHTSVAFTGVDLLVPNGTGPGGHPCEGELSCYDNNSQFVFYENGKVIDNGNGRQMILGTYVGSTACDGCSVINKDAHLDVMQTAQCEGGAGLDHFLYLRTAPNNDTIIENVPADISNQFSIQTIYLGNNSNISIGTNGSEGTSMEVTMTEQCHFPLTTFPEFVIDGDFFSFETRGGENGLPATSNVTGQGGIFVDMNGAISIGSDTCGYIANIGTMVTRSRNGIVDLPKSRVFFDSAVGIAAWNLDLSDPAQRVIIPADRHLSDYNLNWMFVKPDYDVYMPYIISCYNPCMCPPVTDMNVAALPVVEGSVQQMQIQGARIGSPANLKIRGGNIGELVMLPGFNSAEAPVAVLVLEEGGKVGLGSAHRNVDSLFASIQMGLNGINVIHNGLEGTVALNEDVIVNNVCALLAGPDIAPNAVLHFTSDNGSTLRISRNGILDLSHFVEGQVIEIGGNIRVIFEPGATVIFGNGEGTGPTLRFAENATCEFLPVHNLNNLFTDDVNGTDNVRVQFTGVGVLEFTDCSRADLPRNAFVGIQSLVPCDFPTTTIRLHITDSGEFHIGDSDCRTPGGVLQVGNTVDFEEAVVTFSLILDGPEALFEVGPQGFFGSGVGIVSKYATGHDDWEVAPLANLQKVSFDLHNGIFKHAQIYEGADDRSALVALCDSVNGNDGVVYDFFTPELFGGVNRLSGSLLSNITVLGGGNLIAVAASASVFNPVVGIENGFIDANYTAGILASKPLFMRSAAFNVDAFSAQQFLRLHDVLLLNPTTNRAVVAQSELRNEVRLTYVDSAGTTDERIARLDVRRVLGKTQQTVIQRHAKELGATQVALVPIDEAGGAVPRPLRISIEAGN